MEYLMLGVVIGLGFGVTIGILLNHFKGVFATLKLPSRNWRTTLKTKVMEDYYADQEKRRVKLQTKWTSIATELRQCGIPVNKVCDEQGGCQFEEYYFLPVDENSHGLNLSRLEITKETVSIRVPTVFLDAPTLQHTFFELDEKLQDHVE